MSDLQYYLLSASAVQRARLKEQYHDAANKGTIICACGQTRALSMAYHCLYCGLWWCFNCAEKHFGQTVQQWRELRRRQVRDELQGLPEAKILERIQQRAQIAENQGNPASK